MNRFGQDFCPSNPCLSLEHCYRKFTEGERIHIFKEQIKQCLEISSKDDVDLVLRDHSHTDFHTGNQESSKCPIQDYLTDEYNLISVVTVRHPIDSYLSLIKNGWEQHFQPNSFDEYCRRYLAFLEKYSHLKVIRYEDFCDRPEQKMKEICEVLDIAYEKNFIYNYGRYELTGDSGRRGTEKIEKRKRREIPQEVRSEIKKSENSNELIDRLGYWTI